MKTRYLRLIKKQKGFTLIELLAVILILGIIALIAIPTVTSVINDAKKSSLRTTAMTIIKGAEDKCVIEKLNGDEITKKHYIKDYKSETLDIKNLPKEGTVTIDDLCNASAAITDGTFFATGTSQLLEVSTDEKVYEESNNQIETKDSCFIFDSSSKTITGYKHEREDCGTDIAIPAEINKTPVEHIAENAFYKPANTDNIIYFGITSISTPAARDNIYENLSKGLTVPYGYYSYLYVDLENAKKYCFYLDKTYDLVSLDYEIKDDDSYITCQLTGYKILKSEMNITSVDFSGAANLKTIGENAFVSNKISNIKFGPKNINIIEIGKSAFSNNLLTGEVDISYLGISRIEHSVFDYNNISKFVFPNSLKSIGQFSIGENSVEELTFPEGFETTEWYSAAYNNQLKNISFPSTLKTIGGASFVDSVALESVEIPSDVIVGESAFEYTGLKNIIVNDNVAIEKYAFSQNYLTNLSFGKGVTLSQHAFSYCEDTIDSLNIPGSITTIPETAFYYCKINNLIFNSGTTTIAKNAFRDSKIKNVTFSDSITRIGSGAFMNCALTQLDIPATLSNIEYSAFTTAFASGAVLNIQGATTLGSNTFGYNNFSEVNIYSDKIRIPSNIFACNKEATCKATFNVNAAEGTIANAPWGNPYATINYLK